MAIGKCGKIGCHCYQTDQTSAWSVVIFDGIFTALLRNPSKFEVLGGGASSPSPTVCGQEVCGDFDLGFRERYYLVTSAN